MSHPEQDLMVVIIIISLILSNTIYEILNLHWVGHFALQIVLILILREIIFEGLDWLLPPPTKIRNIPWNEFHETWTYSRWRDFDQLCSKSVDET